MPSAAVEALIAEADVQVSALEREAAAAVAAADEAEAQLALAGADERSSAWAMIQLERFVSGLRAEVEAEAAEIIEAAELRARRRLEDARAQAEVQMRDASLPPVEAPRGPTAGGPELATGGADAEAAAEAAPVPTDAAGDHAPAPAVQPDPERQPEPDPKGDVLFEEIGPERLGIPDRLEFALENDFWPVETKRRRRLSRPSTRVIATQGAAALLVLAAVLVRVS
jgi:hypothetical protein